MSFFYALVIYAVAHVIDLFKCVFCLDSPNMIALKAKYTIQFSPVTANLVVLTELLFE